MNLRPVRLVMHLLVTKKLIMTALNIWLMSHLMNKKSKANTNLNVQFVEN